VNTVTLIVARYHRSERQFTVFRLGGDRLEVVAHFETLEEAKLAAERYAEKARLTGLDVQVVVRG
jgi:GGDEF domain-containing protein